MCCVLQKVFYEITFLSGFADLVCASAVCVSALRNCVTSKYFCV